MRGTQLHLLNPPPAYSKKAWIRAKLEGLEIRNAARKQRRANRLASRRALKANAVARAHQDELIWGGGAR